MRKIFAIAACMALAACITGCATLSDSNINRALCKNQIVSRATLNLKIAEDSKIKDDALRQAALSLDDAALTILNACPPPPAS